MELKKYTRLLWYWSWFIILSALIAGAGALLVSKRTTPVYEASATLLLNQAQSGNTRPEYSDVLMSEHLAKTYAELLSKRPILDTVIQNLKLDTSASSLEKRIRVSVIRDTLLIIVSVEDTEPARAAAIANEIAKVYGEQSRATQSSRYASLQETLDNELSQVQQNIDDAQTNLDTLVRQVLRDELGKVQTAMDQAQLDVERLSRDDIRAELLGIQNDLERLQTNRDLVESLGTDEQVAQQNQLRTRLEQYRSNYDSLLRSLEELRLAETQSNDYLTVVEEASVPTIPIRPRTLLNVLLSAILGGMLMLGLTFLIEYFDNSVRSRDDIEQFIGIPTLGSIGKMGGRGLASKLLALRAPGSPVAEAFRMVRTNLEFAEIDTTIRTLLITSASSNEGKSTTAANLAVTIAQTGKRVVMVDLDLRNPTLHEVFGLSNHRGVTTALLHHKDGSLNEVMLPTSVENLRLIPSGPVPSNPAELLGSQRMADLIEEMKQEADVILFDSSPLLAVADAALLARRCDAALVVARAGRTRIDELRRVRDQIAQTGTRLLGVILNRAPSSPMDRQYQQQQLWRQLRNWQQQAVRKWPFPRSR
jgi:capsular exopolysaccharide synthesis family protein